MRVNGQEGVGCMDEGGLQLHDREGKGMCVSKVLEGHPEVRRRLPADMLHKASMVSDKGGHNVVLGDMGWQGRPRLRKGCQASRAGVRPVHTELS
jgi:hypothetical protein